MSYKIIEVKSRKIEGEQEILDCVIDCSDLNTKLNIDKEKVKAFRNKVKEGIKFPNVEILDELYRVLIIQGNHRIQAHKEEGKYIDATITKDLPEYKWRPHRFRRN